MALARVCLPWADGTKHVTRDFCLHSDFQLIGFVKFPAAHAMAIGSKSKRTSRKALSSSSAGGRASSSSSKVNHSGSRINRHGQRSSFRETLTPKFIEVRKVADDAAMVARLSGEFFALIESLGPAADAGLDMTQAELRAHRAMRNEPGALAQDDDWEMMDDILTGADLLGVSHAGGDLMEVFQSMHEGEWEKHRTTYAGLWCLFLPCSLRLFLQPSPNL